MQQIVINLTVLMKLLALKETLVDVVIVDPAMLRGHPVDGLEAKIAVEEDLKVGSAREAIDMIEGVPEIAAGKETGTGIGQGNAAGQGAGIEIPATRESSGRLILGRGVEAQPDAILWITTLESRMSLEITGTFTIILVEVFGIKVRHVEVQVVVVAERGTEEEIMKEVDVTGLM